MIALQTIASAGNGCSSFCRGEICARGTRVSFLTLSLRKILFVIKNDTCVPEVYI